LEATIIINKFVESNLIKSNLNNISEIVNQVRQAVRYFITHKKNYNTLLKTYTDQVRLDELIVYWLGGGKGIRDLGINGRRELLTQWTKFSKL
jgi:hypothetical protein